MFAAALLIATSARAQNQPALVIYEPFGPQSVSDDAVRMVQPDLENELKGKVEIRHITQGHPGAQIIDMMRKLPADGRVLAALEIETRIGHELEFPDDKEKLEALTPVALLTDSIALALVVPNKSAIRNWDDFKAASKARSLVVCHIGRKTGMEVELDWLEQALGVKFKDRVESVRQGIISALATGDADFGLLAAPTLMHNSLSPLPPLRAIITFGRHREAHLPDVPTFAEVSGNKGASLTGSVAIFGPPGLSEQQRQHLSALFTRVNKDTKVRRIEDALDFSPKITGPRQVEAVIARDLKQTGADLKALGIKPDSNAH